MGLGFVVARLDVLSPAAGSRIVGTALITMSVVFIIGAAVVYLSTVRQLSHGEPFEGRPSWLVLALAALLVLAAIMIVAYMFVTPVS